MSFRIKYWGVRGSLPASPPPHIWKSEVEKIFNVFFDRGYTQKSQLAEFFSSESLPFFGGYGAHTTCAEVFTDKTQVIVDCGSGLRNLGEHMMKGPAGKGQAEIHIFLTHFHWDHLLGIPFFAPHFVKGNVINYYAIQPELEELVRLKFRKPLFPVPFEALGAKIQFHRLEPRQPKKIGDFKVTPYQLDHPDPCWGYRIEYGNRSYSHCVDTEGTRSTREALGPDLPLYQNSDLLYFDAQYTLPELAEKANWGHSAAQIGLEIAKREKIKKVIFAHHDPGATSGQIRELIRQTNDYYTNKLMSDSENLVLPSWEFAFEGMLIDMSEI